MGQLTNTTTTAHEAPSTRPSRPGLVAMAGLVAAGGMLGTTARALLETAFPAGAGAWPWTTFWINLAGSFLLGILLETLSRGGPDHGWRRAVRLGVGTGVIGGFTTYSTFILESVRLAQDGWLITGVIYGLVSVVLGIATAGTGIATAATVSRWRRRRQDSHPQAGRP